MSSPVETGETIHQVATIAANNDSDIGSLIAEAVEAVGQEGVITVEEAKSAETDLKVVEGMEVDKGYISPYFITDREKKEAILENPMILITDQTVNSAQDLLPSLRGEHATEEATANHRQGCRRRGTGDVGAKRGKQGSQSRGDQGPGLWG